MCMGIFAGTNVWSGLVQSSSCWASSSPHPAPTWSFPGEWAHSLPHPPNCLSHVLELFKLSLCLNISFGVYHRQWSLLVLVCRKHLLFCLYFQKVFFLWKEFWVESFSFSTLNVLVPSSACTVSVEKSAVTLISASLCFACLLFSGCF